MELNVTPVTQNCEYAKILILLKYNLLLFSDKSNSYPVILYTQKSSVLWTELFFTGGSKKG